MTQQLQQIRSNMSNANNILSSFIKRKEEITTTDEINNTTKEILSKLSNLSSQLLQEQILNEITRQKDHEILQLKNIIH